MPSSTDSDMGTEVGDQAWNDEELARAMALSLQEASPPSTEPAQGGASGLEDLLHLLPRADGYSPLSTSPSPRPTPPILEEAAHSTDHATAHAGRSSDGAGRARGRVSEPVVVPSGLRPYVSANPISGGTDTHNRTIVVSLRVPQPCHVPSLFPSWVVTSCATTQDAVLREVEQAGSEFSGEVVRKTMDAMLESGKVLPVRGLETIVCSGPSETYSCSQLVRAALWRAAKVCMIVSWYLWL